MSWVGRTTSRHMINIQRLHIPATRGQRAKVNIGAAHANFTGLRRIKKYLVKRMIATMSDISVNGS